MERDVSVMNAIGLAIEAHQAKFIDLRFTDTLGKEQHLTIPISAVDDQLLQSGKMFDGSSIKGWQKIHQSDLALLPDLSTIMLDPFYQESTLILRCDVVDPDSGQPYARCPRSIAKRGQRYLQSTGIADDVLFGPEPEFFLFDDVRWDTSINSAFYHLDAEEGQWNSGQSVQGGNIGHRPGVKGGYFPVPPVDSGQDIRSAIAETLQKLGIVVEAHHHEVATANQSEVATRFNTLLRKADEMQV
ncbi:MAG: glutamine synthetase, partial [Legionella sp. 21-45-4]